MAELEMEDRRRLWPWVLALLVLAALAWGMLELLGDGDGPVRVGAAEPAGERLLAAPGPWAAG